PEVWRCAAATGKPTGQPITLPAQHDLKFVVPSPDGQAVLTGGFDTQKERGEACLWSVASGALLCPPLIHPHPLTATAFSPYGHRRRPGGGTAASELRRWDARTGAALGESFAKLSRCQDVGFSPDGKCIHARGVGLSATQEEVHLWEADTGKPVPHG